MVPPKNFPIAIPNGEYIATTAVYETRNRNKIIVLGMGLKIGNVKVKN